jgi:hypothetical protein
MLGVSRVDPDLTSTCHVVALRNTDHHFHSEYAYGTNGLHAGIENRNLEA